MSISQLKTDDLELKYDIKLENIQHDSAAFVAQDRIDLAIKKLVNMRNLDYNLYIVGNLSKQDKTNIKNMILKNCENITKELYDYCYVNNFENSKMPLMIKLPASKGKKLKEEMDNFVEYLEKNVPAVFESKEYEKRIQDIIDEYSDKEKNLYEDLEKKASELEFVVKPASTGIIINPVVTGRIISEKEFSVLPNDTKKEIEKKRKQLETHISNFLRQTRELEKEKQEKIHKINDEMGILVVGNKIDEIKEKFKNIKSVRDYLDNVENYTLDNISIFLPQKQQQFPFLPQTNKYIEYKVNIIIDNSQTKEIPIIYEENPTYYNLFGKIEKQAYFGALVTNFTNIMPGSMHKANGGYLILDAMSVFSNVGVWDTLKKSLSSGNITIEDLGEKYGLIATETLKPQSIDIDVNIILIGTEFVYNILYNYDEYFVNLFKLKTNFNPAIDLNENNINQYVSKIISFCEENNIKKPDKSGLNAIFKYSSRLSGENKKLWSYSSDIFDIIKEAQLISDTNTIKYEDIKKVVEEKIFLKSLFKEKIYEMIKDNQILVDLKGTKIGQINGLSVIELGNFAFGQPNRITAKSFIGKKGILNVERESKLTGKIFDKASYIITGYLGYMYAFDKELNISATISFDQSYSIIEGDSASIAETLALLSSIANIPLKQNLAVTGSMDQNGIVQPIGGVNEKIEGFYEICKITGNLGSSGVVIPKSNKQNLVLSDDVLESIKRKEFNIYTIETIDDTIELFSNIKAGKRIKNKFERDTFHYYVDKKLKNMSSLINKELKGE